MPRVSLGTVTAEIWDNAGNLLSSQMVENEITLYNTIFDPPITVHKDETLTLSYIIPGPCPDCKDGYYYPFAGPREDCQTCKT